MTGPIDTQDWLEEIAHQFRVRLQVINSAPTYEERERRFIEFYPEFKAAAATHLLAAVEEVIGEDLQLDGYEYTETAVVGAVNKRLAEQRQRLAVLVTGKKETL